MTEQFIENYRIISAIELARAIKEGRSNSERFCFILGSGASVSSKIPAGGELERRWMAEMEEEPGFKEVCKIAEMLQEYKLLENDFKEIEQEWKKVKHSEEPLPSKYYFDIYKLRFYPNHRNGYHYLERVMADARPSIGYYPLALILTDGGGNNLVITTNFDSLVEDALFLYTRSKPLVINHELLADYAGDPNIKRPIIEKVHRGIFFDPMNRPEETNELKGKWHDVLTSVFQNYTPIVIGYGGGDNSLMELLSEESIIMKNGIYWCYVQNYGLPSERIQKLVQNKKGYLVCTAGFDATMLTIGNALFPSRMDVHEVDKYLNNQINMQIANYEKEYKELKKEYEELEKEKNGALNKGDDTNQSRDEFRKEIEKMMERGEASENKRQELKQMTAWDYRRQGGRCYDAKQYDKAVESYSKAIREQPSTAEFYNDRGCAYFFLGEYEKALFDFNKAIELNPDVGEAYGNRGDIYSELGEYEKALSDYNKVIEMNPNNKEIYNNRGYAYSNLSEHEKAIFDFNKAIELNPNTGDFYINRAYAYEELGEYEKAISDYNKSIELNPNDELAYFNRGYIYTNLGESEKAISDYNKAIELNPNDEIAYNNRGYIYIELGKYKKALYDLNKSIALNPDYANPYKHCGVIWKKKENFEKAICFLTQAIELDPKYKDAYLERAKVYRLCGENEKAQADEIIAAQM